MRPLRERSTLNGSVDRLGVGSMAHWRGLTIRRPLGRKEWRKTLRSATIVPSSAMLGEKYGLPAFPSRVRRFWCEPSTREIQTLSFLTNTIAAPCAPAGVIPRPRSRMASVSHLTLDTSRPYPGRCAPSMYARCSSWGSHLHQRADHVLDLSLRQLGEEGQRERAAGHVFADRELALAVAEALAVEAHQVDGRQVGLGVDPAF